MDNTVITQKGLTLSTRTTRDTQFEIWIVRSNLTAPTVQASDWAAQVETINGRFYYYPVYVMIVKLNQNSTIQILKCAESVCCSNLSDCCPHVRLACNKRLYGSIKPHWYWRLNEICSLLSALFWNLISKQMLAGWMFLNDGERWRCAKNGRRILQVLGLMWLLPAQTRYGIVHSW